MAIPTPQNLDRLAKAMMQRHQVPYDRAREMLGGLSLRLVAGEEVGSSAALQAAFLTAVNSGKRAFRGGVTVEIPENLNLRLPWPGATTLNEVALELGGRPAAGGVQEGGRTLTFGSGPLPPAGLRVVCDGWRGGILPAGFEADFEAGADFSLAGVFAGALGVGRSFLEAAQISNRGVEEPVGLSLWRPETDWLKPEASGPQLEQMPAKLWLLGLGHLGQAYAWSLGMLPFENPSEVLVSLQDFDDIEEGNWSAGLLCEHHEKGRMKTRLSADWLELRGFRTRIIERHFDENTKRRGEEPRIALCGFDNAASRRLLENAGFDLVVESGIGGSLDRFDRILLHTFPEASAKASDIWARDSREEQSVDPLLFGKVDGQCGMVLEEIAGKAISSSFTGACASSLVLAEVLKAIHGGARREFLNIQLRDLERPESLPSDENYQCRVARNGLVNAK